MTKVYILGNVIALYERPFFLHIHAIRKYNIKKDHEILNQEFWVKPGGGKSIFNKIYKINKILTLLSFEKFKSCGRRKACMSFFNVTKTARRISPKNWLNIFLFF